MIGIVEVVTAVSAFIAMAYFYIEFERPDIKRRAKDRAWSFTKRALKR